MNVLIAECDLVAHPSLAQRIAQIDRQTPPIGYERLLYRHLFIVPGQNRYVRVILDEKNRLVIPLYLDDSAIHAELSVYCAEHAYRLFVMDGYREWLAAEAKLVPVGVWHNISVTDFNLRGAPMRKLRYLVTKFGKLGNATVRELSTPEAGQLDAMRELMASWACAKGQVIEHSAVCMRELLQGHIAPAHRVFLTELDGQLCSIIVTARSSNGVWIMDQEFYDPRTAPLGHMEYAVVAIIEKLRAEGEQTFSLGLTWHPFIFADDPRNDLDGWNWLKQFAEKGSLLNKIFTLGAANYQFKKKFAPAEEPFFAYFQEGLPFEVLLQFWPIFMHHSLTAERLIEQLKQKPGLPHELGEFTHTLPAQISEPDRVALLRAAGSLRALAYQQNPLDLQTDSWWGLQSPPVREQLARLQARTPEQTLQAAKAFRQLIPFKHVIMTPRGRDAEGIFYRAWPGARKRILSTLSWTTTLAYQLGNGFEVQELPHPLFRNSVEPIAYTGEFDLERLEQALPSSPNSGQADIALVAIELLNNAAGGAPVRLSHLQQVRERLAPFDIPLVVDATRVVRNALLIQEYDHTDSQPSLWDLVTRLLSMGDHIVASLCKDFGVPQGGMIATNDDALADSVRTVLEQGGWGGAGATAFQDPRWEALIFPDLPSAAAMVQRQRKFMQRLATRLADSGSRFAQVGPGCGHALVLDVSRLQRGSVAVSRSVAEASQTSLTLTEQFLNELFLQTGIRGGLHQTGMQRNTGLEQCIRLAFPLGLDEQSEQLIIDRLGRFLEAAVAQPTTVPAPDRVACPLDSTRSDGQVSGPVVAETPMLKSLQPISRHSQQSDIAIIGIGARLPGAENYQQFWDALRQGKNFIEPIPANRWDRAETPGSEDQFAAVTTRCQFGSFIQGIENFDASFFGIQPEEARIMDPQERLSLEIAWACLEDAGYTPEALSRERCGAPVGVFSGVTYNDYQKLIPATNHSCFVNARIAYFFDFQGPSLSVDSGCCSSLTAIEQACQSLARGDCAHALVVASNLLLHPHHYASLSSLLSSRGQPESHPFGNDDGWIPAEGVVAILLKPLERALADKDHIHGVIKSARTRQEGRTAWLTAPNPRKQAALIREHFEESGISPQTISYVEAAANGSPLGDAVELEGLTQVFDAHFPEKQSCPLGSVKSGLGHAEAVSTLVQLNRVLLQFKYREILPMVGAHQFNPKIKLERTPFFIPETLQAWPVPTREIEGRQTAMPRRATISSFGGGGHMGHLIVQEPPQRSTLTAQPVVCVLPLSAGSSQQLLATAQRFIAHFTSIPLSEQSLAEVMFTLCTGRRVFESRVVFLASSVQEFVFLLRRFVRGESDPNIITRANCTAPQVGKLVEPSSAFNQTEVLTLAARWIHGVGIDWDAVFTGLELYRVSLPTYCFSSEHHAIPWTTDQTVGAAAVRSTPAALPRVSQSVPRATVDNVSRVCCEVFARALHCTPERVDLTCGLDRLGFDSVMVAVVTEGLEQHFGPMPQTLLFECRTLQEVIDHVSHKVPEATAASPKSLPRLSPTAQVGRRDDIAIIGLAGRFPLAENPQALWENLVAGRNCVTQIPAERWDWSDFFEANRLKAAEQGKSYGKWGGFLSHHDCFDALFFNISPREARAMDPQERLFLETAWSAIEDAGYTRASLSFDQRLGSEPKVGVYVGSSWNEYPLFGGHDLNDAAAPVSTNACNIANRVSYWFDFKGSSLTLDTACSSSLTALHLACATLRSGENDLALVGGVNLSLHPNKYLALTQGQFLSTKGLCESFGEGGDGYVPSEAVVAVLLKPKSRAIADGDHIYGVIRGSALSHGGKTNGYSVPDPAQQAAVIRDALADAGVSASEISYIEAHGTGTALGDPIEIAGLSQVFEPAFKAADTQRTSEKCAIGSVKSNLGHCEAASGLVGLAKILLQFKYRHLVASLHSTQPNRRIDFENSRFYIPQQFSQWHLNSQSSRLAGLSSFGAGGTNVHVVLEEHVSSNNPSAKPEDPQIVLLSAWNTSRLNVQVANLLAQLEGEISFNLKDLAYTLQVGREAMPQRLGLVVNSFEQLKSLLRAFLRGEKQNLWVGRASGSGQAFKGDLLALFQQQAYEPIISGWIAGALPAWSALWAGQTVQRVSLPTYPFAGERHWVTTPALSKSEASTLESIATQPSVTSQLTDRHPASVYLETLAFEEVWVDTLVSEPDEPLTGLLQRVVCLLSEPEHQRAISSVFKSELPDVELIFITQSALVTRDLRALVAQTGAIDALLYLWPLEQPEWLPDAAQVHQLLLGLGVKGAPRRLMLAGCFGDELSRVHLNGWVGFERSLKTLWPACGVSTVMGDVSFSTQEPWQALWRELVTSVPGAVRFEEGRRLRLQVREAALPRTQVLTDRSNRIAGTTLITGGVGGLGLLVAEYLAKQGRVNLALLGRSALTSSQQARLAALESATTGVQYVQADVLDLSGMRQALEQVRARFGPITALFHLAGISDQQTIFEKSAEDFARVLGPKVTGTLNLDQLLAEDPLERVCYFSSSSALLGDFGGCAYAIANRFLMDYAAYRNRLMSQGTRSGFAVVIGWPLWREGGMGLENPEGVDFYLKLSGQCLLETRLGLDLLELALNPLNPPLTFLCGDAQTIRRFMSRVGTSVSTQPQVALASTSIPTLRRQELRGLSDRECLLRELRETIATLMEIAIEALDSDRNFADFGFDSVSLAQFAKSLSELFAFDLTPDLFFGHSTLDALGDYLLAEHTERLAARYREATPSDLSMAEPVSPAHTTAQGMPQTHTDAARAAGPEAAPKQVQANLSTPAVSHVGLSTGTGLGVQEPIAVIGMSGRFPQSRDVGALWRLLVEGRDAVEEIPHERFDWRTMYGEPSEDAQKTNCKWCGTVPGVAEFDPLFFEISPREARGMDPRQRQLLQESWNALEDAGYGAEQLARETIGMFVGVEEGDFQGQGSSEDGVNITSNHTGVLAARLAYFLNLTGPVMALNTACSSSLVAVHQACQSLRLGECDSALAGGVSLLLTPAPFIGMSQAGLLSKQGQCRAFARDADGIVPGEGVAVVVLKRLSRALADGDPIHAIIEGSGINYDGKTNGMTAPSRVAQRELIRKVLRESAMDTRRIGHIVTHGTGTALGDPVEINALDEAFRDTGAGQGQCALTSIKSNLGHAFAASGVMSLIALIQSLRHRTIPATLHCAQPSDYIRWDRSPFYVNQANRAWPQPVVGSRVGAVSAFGMSGTNAHVLVSEYVPQDPQIEIPAFEAPYQLLVLSAKSKESLQGRVQALIAALKGETQFAEQASIVSLSEASLSRVAYTLLTGRHHLRYRCAIVVQNHADAIYLLEQFEAEPRPGLFKGEMAREFSPRQMVRDWLLSPDRRAAALHENPTAYREMLFSMAEFYCQGYDIPYRALQDGSMRKINAPTYPFMQDLYWPVRETFHAVQPALNHNSGGSGVLLYRPSWVQGQFVIDSVTHAAREGQFERLVITCGVPARFLADIEHLSISRQHTSLSASYTESAVELLSQLKQRLKLAPNRPILIQLLVFAQGPEQVFSGLLGLLRTVSLEYPAVRAQCLELDETYSHSISQGLLEQVAARWPLRHLRVSAKGVEQKTWVESNTQTLSDAALHAPWRRDGVYLITGGCGGLGMIFAHEIVQRAPGARVVLCGRRGVEPVQRTLPVGCEYLQADISLEADIALMLETIRQRYGRLDGVLHAAGLLQDSLIANKTEEMFSAVLAPKVKGSDALLRAALEYQAEFIVFFSSVSAAFGNVGQADYAVACAFQDALAEQYGAQTSSRTKILSIEWPLWRAGGMRPAPTHLSRMQRNTALRELDTEVGLATFYRAFALGASCVLVLNGEIAKLRQAMTGSLGPQAEVSAPRSVSIPQQVMTGTLVERTLAKLTTFVSEHLCLPSESLEPREPLEAFGVDSLMSAQLRQRLAHIFEDISPTLLYEFPTLELLSVYLSQTYPDHCNNWTLRVALSPERSSPLPQPDLAQQMVAQSFSQLEQDTAPLTLQTPQAQVVSLTIKASEQQVTGSAIGTHEPIAIIGVSVRFPGAASLQEFADNIFSGVQSTTEIPAQRWNWATEGPSAQRTEHDQPDSALGRWGGFIPDAYAFDPLFFNITPHDAARIDPQERLFLEHCWNALADAGYSATTLPDTVKRHAGVFAGITKQGFGFLAHEQTQEYLSTSYSALVNRVSSILDLRGPSVAVDSMCSSALVAIHEACDYLRTRGGKLAIAGGVNLYLHHSSYTALAASQSLGSGSHCAAFAENGGGFVPGEAVGAFILKPYSDALRDGDSIYALLRGSAASHGGRGGGFGVPNPTQQAAVIREALQSAGIDPRSVSYIESAANGQAIGDAVEMRALSEVFASREACQGEYRIGSVKPNIGHAEAASGVAQLAKVLISLNKRQLAPTLISGPLNRDIQFDRLPFVLQRERSDWNPVRVEGIAVARRAGITSVGAGGVCAHLLVEEFLTPAAAAPQTEEDSQALSRQPELLIFSAKTAERLTAHVRDWLKFLTLQPEISVEDLAYTLQTGREMMAHRLAVVADNRQSLQDALRLWCERTPNVTTLPGCYWAERMGSVSLGASTTHIGAQDADSLARFWVAGGVIDWSRLHRAADPARTPKRLHGLPGYSFERRLCQLLVRDLPPTPAPLSDASLFSSTALVTNKAAEFYAIAANAADKTYREEYLTFAPFPQKIPGFSVTRVCFNPEKFPLELAMVQARQREMRRTLFNMVDLSKVRKGLDFGCGHATDIIKFTEAYPALVMDGFTITRSQAELGNTRIQARGLATRATVYHKDSARDPFPSSDYDLIIGVEVSFHIRDKDALFNKISQALSAEGSVLLADYIANTRGSIVDPNVEVTIPTRSQWVEILSKAALAIDDIVDVSPQIANFLYDPEVELNIRALPEVGQATWRNYVNQSAALEQGLISYSLIKLRRDHSGDAAQLRVFNEEMLSKQRPYPFVELGVSLADTSTVPLAPYATKTVQPPQSSQPPHMSPSMRTPHLNAAGSTASSRIEAPQTANSASRVELGALRATLTEVFVDTLNLDHSDLAREQNFKQLGVGSVNALKLLEAINQRFELTLPTSIVFSYDTLDSLSNYIAQCVRPDQLFQTPSNQSAIEDEIVVIGMSCRCAGADNPEQLWSVVSEGRECLTPMPDDWQAFLREHGTTMHRPRYGSIEDVDAFDPLFFRISPKEAENMDLTQRVLLQEGYRAFEDAGYAPQALTDQQIGCYIGVGASAPPALSDSPYMAMLGSDTSISASRLAYFLNLKGPVLAINTACSSSLVAIDLAYQALRNKTVDMALAGGITIWTHPAAFISMQDAGMLSPTGVCRPFDKEADGTMVGDGVGLLLLKRRADALRDGDQIYGVIRGSGTNQDGRTAGITVPSFLAQSRLQTSIYRAQGIDVGDIQYIETHGTATKLGDPVEIHALTQSLGGLTDQRGFCAIGSLKANIGHTAAAAGVLNLIKVLQCLKHHQLPPAVNYSTPNEHIDFATSPVYVNQSLRAWPLNSKGTRLAAVSSFGYSGTNAHLLIEQDARHAQRMPWSASSRQAEESPTLIVISAQVAARLEEQVRCLLDYLETTGQSLALSEVAYTLQIGRDAMDERLALVVNSREELCQTLRAELNERSAVNNNSKRYRGSVKQDLRALIAGGEEALKERVDSLLRQQRLEELADVWSKGASIDWRALERALTVRRVSLPTYRFAQDRYPGIWRAPSSSKQLRTHSPEAVMSQHIVKQPVGLALAQVQTFKSVTTTQDPSLLCFDENWQRCPLTAVGAQVNPVDSILCLIEEGTLLEALQIYLARVSPVTQVYSATPVNREGTTSYRVKGLAERSVEAGLHELAAQFAQISTVMYLLPVQQPALVAQAAAIAELLQTLRSAGIVPGQIILVGQYSDGLELSHLESWIGFERSIARAWPGVGIKVLMLERQEAADLVGEAWLARLWAEVLQTQDRSILYRQAERHALKLQVEGSGSQSESSATTEVSQ